MKKPKRKPFRIGPIINASDALSSIMGLYSKPKKRKKRKGKARK